MPTTLDKFFLSIAEKAGLPADDARVAEILSHTELNRITVHDELASQVNKSLIAVEAAKNHSEIKSHYIGQIMKMVDKGLEDAYELAGFTEDEIKRFNEEKSSTKRIPIVTAALKAKMEAVGDDKKGGSKGDAEALRQQINDLNTKLAEAKNAVTAKEQEYNNSLNGFIHANKLGSEFSKYKTIFDGQEDEVRFNSLNFMLTKKLQDNGLEMVLGDDKKSFVLRRKDGTDYFDPETQKRVTADAFMSKVFADGKVLQQSAPAGTNGATGEPIGQPAGAAGGQQTNTKYADLYAGTLKSLEKNPVQMV